LDVFAIVSNASSSSGNAARPAILLLEEYGALGVAISSALKKFAPSHTTHTARSLKEAETLAGKVEPELFLIDVDPPWPKITQFLGKMRSEFPEARVLVIGATIPKGLIENRGSYHALQFLEKPFDVAELGAAVQALLGPWKESEDVGLRGTLRSFSAVDAALLQCASGRTVIVEVKQNGGKSGELHFVDGQLFHVENGKRAGVEALEELLSWANPDLREKEKKTRTTKRTIPAPWTEAFLTALQKTMKQPPAPRPASVVRPAAARSPAKTGKKIVVIDDTEMLLIFVEDVLSTEQPDLQITTASNGVSGVKEIERIRPDLVLLDYSLPDFNGDEVCRRLLENEATANIPVLMMSGHVPEMRRTAAYFENVVATIEKPFRSEALVAIVQETLAAGPAAKTRRKTESRKKAEAAPPAAKASPPAEPPPKAQSVKRAESVRPPRSQRTVVAPPSPKTETAVPPSPPPKPAESPVAAPLAEPEVFAAPATPPKRLEPALGESQPAELSVETTLEQPKSVEPPRVEHPPAAPAPLRPPPPAPRPPKTPAPAPSRPKPATKLPPIPFEHPVPHVISVAPPIQQIPRPGLASLPIPTTQPEAARPPEKITAPVLTPGMNQVILGLFLEVISMQLTPALRMGTIRARVSSLTASLHVASPQLRAALPPNGFELGAVDLDRNGRIAAMRLIPTIQPFTPLETRNAFQIGGVTVVPVNSDDRLQLTPSVGAPMRMHLLAQMEVAGVELFANFQIAQLVLKNRSNSVRVTLNEESIGQEKTGTACETTGVQLDAMARLAELTLNPV
jgi:DNA-binding response OmpR family regulator